MSCVRLYSIVGHSSRHALDHHGEGTMHNTSLEKQADALYRGTVALRDLANDHLVPLLESILHKTDHDHAVMGTYYRMHLWMLDLGKLNHPVHFQGVLNAT